MTHNNFDNLIIESLDFHSKAPYIANQSDPVDRWCMIPESFSKEFVSVLLDLVPYKYEFVFDPFMGSGSTMLQVIRRKNKFLGGELDPDLVIASYAKLFSGKADIELFKSDILKVEDFIGKQPYHPQESFENYLSDTQSFILSISSNRINTIVILSALYQSIRKSNIYLGIDNWQQVFNKTVFEFLEDIKWSRKFSDLANPIALINWGDSLSVDWGLALNALSLNANSMGVMLTSPTFVNTIKDKGQLAIICHKLAQTAASSLNIKRYTESAEEFSDSSNYIDLPKQSKINPLLKAMFIFKKFSKTGSYIFIENENPFIDGAEIELDIDICKQAELLGIHPQKIMITHYVQPPHNVNYSRLGARGSILIFKI